MAVMATATGIVRATANLAVMASRDVPAVGRVAPIKATAITGRGPAVAPMARTPAIRRRPPTPIAPIEARARAGLGATAQRPGPSTRRPNGRRAPSVRSATGHPAARPESTARRWGISPATSVRRPAHRPRLSRAARLPRQRRAPSDPRHAPKGPRRASNDLRDRTIADLNKTQVPAGGLCSPASLSS